jgi:hypothetical protein
MSCRTGPRRVERPLRGVYTDLAKAIFCGPPVGRAMMIPTNGRANVAYPVWTS